MVERDGGQCDHRKCRGGPCRKYSQETFRYSDEDKALGQRLVSEGWQQISHKYRKVARLVKPFPRQEDVIRVDALDSAAYVMIERRWHRMKAWAVRDLLYTRHVEVQQLTLQQFRAFKHAGGL